METNCGKSFVRCGFHHAVLSRSWLAGEFIDFDFSGADLSHTLAVEVRFTGCRFDAAKLIGAHWVRTHFENCSYHRCEDRQCGVGASAIRGRQAGRSAARFGRFLN
jgi:uncharacterized protein YjbI with pentapeptide repeats